MSPAVPPPPASAGAEAAAVPEADIAVPELVLLLLLTVAATGTKPKSRENVGASRCGPRESWNRWGLDGTAREVARQRKQRAQLTVTEEGLILSLLARFGAPPPYAPPTSPTEPRVI